MKNVMTLLLMLLIPMIVSAAVTPKLEYQQLSCIQYAYEQGSKIELYDDTWGQSVAMLAYQESACNGSVWQTNGVVVGDFDRNGQPKSLGAMQVQEPTARHINTIYPHLFDEKFGVGVVPTEEELIIALLTDVKFNIRVGAHYFAWLLEYRKGDWELALLSYNRGTGKNLTDVNDYIRKAKKWRKLKIVPVVKGRYKIVPRRKQ